MDIQISLEGLTEITGMLTNYPEIAAKHLHEAMVEITDLLYRETVDATPTVEGHLRGSITREVQVSDTGFIGVVGSASPYVVAVELGTKPHLPPIAPLIDWVEKRGLAKVFSIKTHKAMKPKGRDEAAITLQIAEAIAWKIFHHGTQGQFMFTNTWNKQQAYINQRFVLARGRIMADMMQHGKA